MNPEPFEVCTISFEKPDPDAAAYRVVKWGYDTDVRPLCPDEPS